MIFPILLIISLFSFFSSVTSRLQWQCSSCVGELWGSQKSKMFLLWTFIKMIVYVYLREILVLSDPRGFYFSLLLKTEMTPQSNGSRYLDARISAHSHVLPSCVKPRCLAALTCNEAFHDPVFEYRQIIKQQCFQSTSEESEQPNILLWAHSLNSCSLSWVWK